MGCDKSKLRIGARSLLQHVRHAAGILDLPVRVIRRDKLPRCGPLGGIYTGLITSKHDAELFLACDMPFIDVRLLKRLVSLFRKSRGVAFAHHKKVAGFPCIIPRKKVNVVITRISLRSLSIQDLARSLRAAYLSPTSSKSLTNLNTPAELEQARKQVSTKRPHCASSGAKFPAATACK